MKYLLLNIGIPIMLLFLLTSIIIIITVNAQTDTNTINMTNLPLINKEFSVSIGDLIFESKTQSEGKKYQILIKKNLKYPGQVMEQ